MKQTVKNYVVKNLLQFMQGKETDNRIGNVRIFWHGEFGPVSQCFVHLESENGDEVVDFEEYMTGMDHKEWFDALAEDITNVILDLLVPDEKMKMDSIMDNIKNLYFNIK